MLTSICIDKIAMVSMVLYKYLYEFIHEVINTIAMVLFMKYMNYSLGLAHISQSHDHERGGAGLHLRQDPVSVGESETVL